tara:strand:+ start:438 stop:740 length:303 start_codon:yes stop_codon:yes gene_type:complete
MTRRILLPLLAAFAVSACAVTGRENGEVMLPPDFDTVADSCGAEAREYLIGQPIGEVDLDTLARTIRTIRPGQPITMDHRPDRLNLDLDGDGAIVRLWCG